ncbi:MAG TPA: hypothetical protein VGS11_05030 [Candidatus Bathyarchaeia archaeon]|nr:hypothetical protein [Candidatus Bathyarchaeia archaeon]
MKDGQAVGKPTFTKHDDAPIEAGLRAHIYTRNFVTNAYYKREAVMHRTFKDSKGRWVVEMWVKSLRRYLCRLAEYYDQPRKGTPAFPIRVYKNGTVVSDEEAEDGEIIY